MTLTRLKQPAFIGVLALGFATVLLLAFAGGGYDVFTRGQVGIVIWGSLLIGVGASLLPLRKPGRLALCAALVLAMFVLWTGLSLIWSESGERTMADLGRTVMYLGVFALAIALRSSHGVRRMVAAVAAAIVVVAIFSLVSRLFPGAFPGAVTAARQLPESTGRLAYPLNYWNGLGILVAIGIPLILHLATTLRSAAGQGLAAAAIPILSLTLFLTYSRSGVGAALIAILVYLAFVPDRFGRLLTIGLGAVGSAVLIIFADRTGFVADGPLNAAPSTGEGFAFLALVAAVCLAVGLGQFAIHRGTERGKRPEWTYPSRALTSRALIGAGAAAFLVVVALFFTGKPHEAWDDFTTPATVTAQGSERLQTLNGNNRYQFWKEAIDQNASAPLIGRGSGTFEFWTNRSEETNGFVRDAHSLILETLGELGFVGALLLLGFLGLVVIGGGLRTARSASARKSQMAAALAGCVAFIAAAMVDWTWELAVVPVVFMLLASVLVTAGDSSSSAEAGTLRWQARLGIAVAAVLALGAISIPLISQTLIQRSERAAESGDLEKSLQLAEKAEAVEPAAASPLVQQALIWEAAGQPAAGLEAAREATERESTNWRTWFVRMRLEASAGEPQAAVRSFREARRLNPNSPILHVEPGSIRP